MLSYLQEEQLRNSALEREVESLRAANADLQRAANEAQNELESTRQLVR